MSVYRQDAIEERGGQPERVLANHSGFGLVSISAGQVRSRDQTVHADPVPEESSHALGLRAETEVHTEVVRSPRRMGGRAVNQGIALMTEPVGRALLRAERERGPDFLRLSNALPALYPRGSEEKRPLDAMLLAAPR